ncbi:MAG TPA: hypothetical protein VNJ53_13610 [Gaiellaceae bacterium]|nr:hypothetical protein [Gaiellaceae bacterium]
MVRRVLVHASLVASLGALVLAQAQAGTGAPPVVPDAPVAGTRTGFLSACERLAPRAQVRCYSRGLLAEVERLGSPASGLPVIDRKVHEVGGFLEAACHSIMHGVGRTWAKRHRVTLETLYRYVPRSNDPGCSAGFGMGMAMYLGPKLVLEPEKVLETCSRLPTRFREYTCIHGAGHALMRGYHSALQPSVAACERLGRRAAPDCAQGAFHDYWIALGGGDDAARPRNAATSPLAVCGAFEFKRPCWYRYFWERRPSLRVSEADDMLDVCGSLAGLHRAGCLSGASLLISRERDPVDHARVCGHLQGADTYDCLRGVNVPGVAGRPFEQLRLIRTCGLLPKETRFGCYAWFGRTLDVVTDGAFSESRCEQLPDRRARISCEAGGERTRQPLRTFA